MGRDDLSTLRSCAAFRGAWELLMLEIVPAAVSFLAFHVKASG